MLKQFVVVIPNVLTIVNKMVIPNVLTIVKKMTLNEDRLEIIVETIRVYSPIKTGEIYQYQQKPDWQSMNNDSDVEKWA